MYSADDIERRSTAVSMQFNSAEVEFDNLRDTNSGPRQSILKTNSLLPRPPRIVVLGPIKRQYSSVNSKVYFLTKVQMPFPSDRHQILCIPE
jgi:hypothetical protein